MHIFVPVPCITGFIPLACLRILISAFYMAVDAPGCVTANYIVSCFCFPSLSWYSST